MPEANTEMVSNRIVPHVVDVEQGLATAPSPRGGSAAISPRTPSSSLHCGDVAMKLENQNQAPLHPGLRVAFKDLTFTVKSNQKKGETAYLLRNVSGYFEANQMTALMGPSGSGKTTLLDLLAGRKTVGKLEGEVVFGGEKPSPQFLRRYGGYVEQFDTLIPTLTVREMLLYTAELKRPRQEPLAAKAAEVDSLLTRLGLAGCKDVKIGDSMTKGISGGQSKRVNIGIALVTNPRVLFLDEPTSGLDSYTANQVMSLVKRLGLEGTTICATIHSPSAFTFNLFDRIIMLVRGQVVYFGEQGPSALSYAQRSWPSAQSLPLAGYTDAEWLVDLVTEADHRGEAQAMAEAYLGSELCQANMQQLEWVMGERSDMSETVRAELAVKCETVTPWWFGWFVMLKYRSSRNYANPAWLGPRIADKLLIALIILTLYLGIGDNFVPEQFMNQAQSLYMWVILPAFGAASYVPAIVLERRLFIRERSDGLYRVFTYLAFKLSEEIALSLVTTLIFSSFVFFGVQYSGTFVVFWLSYFLTLCIGIVLAYLVAALSPSMDVANAALPAFVVIMLFFSGDLALYQNMPNYWRWLNRIDFLRYSWGAVLVDQYDEGRDPEWVNGQTILQYYSYDGADKWAFLGYLSIFFFVFAVLCHLALAYIRHQKR